MKIENKIKTLVEDNEVYKQLILISGICKRIISVIIDIFGKFEDFKTAKQVSSFAGVNLSPFEFGSSVKGRGSISKKGNSY